MEAEKSGEQNGVPEKSSEQEKRKGTGEQYLYALIKCADWVDKPYKQLAEKNRNRPEVMKELYLCACDGVPVEKAIEAQEKNPPEGALKFIRRKFLETATMDEYQEQLTGIKKTTVSLEKEVRQMSGMIKHIVEHVPDFDDMFLEPEQKPEKENVPNSGTKKPEKESVPNSGTKKPEKESVPDSGTKKKSRGIRLPWEKKKGPADFIEKILDAGYSTEQLEYLLDCMEEGLPVEEIEKFSSPKLPVEVMRRLRSIEERKETE